MQIGVIPSLNANLIDIFPSCVPAALMIIAVAPSTLTPSCNAHDVNGLTRVVAPYSSESFFRQRNTHGTACCKVLSQGANFKHTHIFPEQCLCLRRGFLVYLHHDSTTLEPRNMRIIVRLWSITPCHVVAVRRVHWTRVHLHKDGVYLIHLG